MRDDDVGALTPGFASFLKLFADRGIPVSYQIIPELFTNECASFMEARRLQDPGLVDYGQHGLRHQMTVRGKVEYYEFGPERSYEQQLADIRAGQDLLRTMLGEQAPVRVFTPPRHRYDRNTLRALKVAGFSVLSASSYVGLGHRLAYAVGRRLGLTNLGRPGIPYHGATRPDGLFELSVAVGLDDGSTIHTSVDEAMRQVERARLFTQDVGVLFHHQAFESAEGQAYLDELLSRLAALPGASFHTVTELSDRALGLTHGSPS